MYGKTLFHALQSLLAASEPVDHYYPPPRYGNREANRQQFGARFGHAGSAPRGATAQPAACGCG